MEEIWKDVIGYEGIYIVSTLGRIICLHWNNGDTHRYLKPFDNGGYQRVVLIKDGVRKKFLLHRLVAEAFIPNPFDKPFINHIDGNKANNSVSNLEWVTPKENVSHAILNNLRPLVCKPTGLKGHDSPCSKKVLQFSLDGSLVCEWGCAKDAADYIKGRVASIQRVCRHERKTYRGYVWEYANASSNTKEFHQTNPTNRTNPRLPL